MVLRHHRQRRGMTQEALAERAGLSVNAVSALERGERRRPYPNTIEALATALALSHAERATLAALARAGHGSGQPGEPGQPGQPGEQGQPAQPDQPDGRLHPMPQPATVAAKATPFAQTPQGVAQVPRQLPAAVNGFTGRASDLATLDALLPAPPGGGPPTVAPLPMTALPMTAPPTPAHPVAAATSVVISAIGGTAGVGKTALAVMWAHRVKDRFPDGQLYVNLRGYDADQPVSPAEALDGFLRALDVAPERIPPTLEQRAALFRSVLDGRRVLVLLDNANHPDQVRPLLPGTPTSMAIVTSRSSLAGLSVTTGATNLHLDLLPIDEAIALLRQSIDRRRAEAQPRALRQLAELCARLPLALRLCAQHAAARPRLPLADLVAALLDEGERLELLSRGCDQATAIRTVFAWSYRSLTPAQARMFHLLGLHPGEYFAAEHAAALADVAVAEARCLLDDLVDAYLVEAAGSDKYQMHDLLRAYARQLANGRIPAPEGTTASTPAEADAALYRLIGQVLHTTAATIGWLNPNRANLCTDGAPPPRLQPTFTDYQNALSWCERERSNAIAVARAASEAGHPRAAWQLAHAIGASLQLFGNWSEWLELFRMGFEAASSCDDRIGTGHMYNGLAIGYGAMRRFPEAIDALYRALALFEAADDLPGQARTQVNLGDTLLGIGRFDESIDHSEQALRYYRTLDNPHGQALALGTQGEAHLGLGNNEAAVEIFEEVLGLTRKAHHRAGEGRTHIHLGQAHLGLRQYQKAADHLRSGLAICRESGNWPWIAGALRGLGDVHWATGKPRQAMRSWRSAMEIYERNDDPRANEVRRLLTDPGWSG